MFRIIEPKDYKNNKARIDLLRELIDQQQNIELFEEDYSHTTFVVEEAKNDIWIGGFLALRESRNLPESIKRKFDCLYSPCHKVWYGAFFSKLKSEYFLESSSRTRKALCDIYRILYEDFYRSLYQKLIDFGKKQNIRVLTLTLPSTDYLYIDEVHSWPFMSTITPQESLDGDFHGVVSLSSNLYGPSQSKHSEENQAKKELAL